MLRNAGRKGHSGRCPFCVLFGASIKRVQLVSGRRFADQREGLSSSAFVDSAPGGQWRLVGSANHDRVSQGRTRYLEWSGKKCHTVCHDSEMQPTKVSENRSRRYQNRVGLRTTSLQQANRRGKGTHLQDIALQLHKNQLTIYSYSR